MASNISRQDAANGEVADFAMWLNDYMDAIPLNDADLCTMFDISIHTAARWRRGLDAPPPGVRKLVVNEIAGRLHLKTPVG